ncbi:PREDICTED: ribosome-recycling factor, mitochondrial isoform X1 [Lipotes vexillifer]|uniref:Ribosome-recycling factor, mitochondrial n=1 Tax=Lipotes vexillifer TaxID=118797 RepID=A0A340Y595_LIPVE|nr:PREDICTED: ribosome-recycling factor, mitochondrial isoform X1 [Lipotes vexillifer]
MPPKQSPDSTVRQPSRRVHFSAASCQATRDALRLRRRPAPVTSRRPRRRRRCGCASLPGRLGASCGCSKELSSVMALGLRCSHLVHPAFCNFLAALTRPISEVTLKTVSGRQNDHGQYLACPAVPIRHFATKKAKAKGKGQSQTRMNLNTTLVEDIISLEEVDEEMKSVIEALKDNFNKTVNIRTSPGSLDHITVVTADGKLALNQIGQIAMKSPQLILVNMASFPECTAAAIKAIRESGMNLNPEVEETLIRVPIPKVTREHREMLVKLAKQSTNKAKDSLRKVRTNAMNKLKKSKGKASEDTIRLIEKQISQMADDTVAELDRHLAVKTKELLG